MIKQKTNTIARIENTLIFHAEYQLTAKEQKVMLYLISSIDPVRQSNFQSQVITYFSVVDVVEVLSESPNPRRYWSDLKKQDNQLYGISVQLKLTATDGKQRSTDCANRAGIFRIIQSIPSPKAKPFKLWLAPTGEERLQEIEDPAKAMDRVRQGFRDLVYSDEWISKWESFILEIRLT